MKKLKQKIAEKGIESSSARHFGERKIIRHTARGKGPISAPERPKRAAPHAPTIPVAPNFATDRRARERPKFGDHEPTSLITGDLLLRDGLSQRKFRQRKPTTFVRRPLTIPQGTEISYYYYETRRKSLPVHPLERRSRRRPPPTFWQTALRTTPSPASPSTSKEAF